MNHASIIDGVRLWKAKRYRYANADMADLERCLQEAQAQRHRIIGTEMCVSDRDKSGGILARVSGVFFALTEADTNDSLTALRCV